MTRQRAGQVLLGIAISGVCLWLAFRQVPFDQVGPAVRQANLWFLAPALMALAADVGIRAARWSVLLRPVARISWTRLLSPTIIGYMGNMMLPARLGEVLRATLVGRVLQDGCPRGDAALRPSTNLPRIDGSRWQYSCIREPFMDGGHVLQDSAPGKTDLGDWTSAALGNIALERVLDVLASVALLAITAQFVPHPDWLTAGLNWLAVSCLVALLALGVLVVFRPAVMRWFHRGFERFSWAARPLRWADHLLAGLEALRDPRLMFRAALLTAAIWGVSALEFYWVIRAFDLPLGMMQATFLMVGIGLATVIPSAPAALGTFELAGISLLAVLGIDRAAAFSFTVVMHLVWSAPLLVAGLALLWRTGYFVPKPATE